MHARKASTRYLYYVSCALNQGRPADVGSVPRVSGPAIEKAIVATLRDRYPAMKTMSDHDLIAALLVRAVLKSGTIEIEGRSDDQSHDNDAWESYTRFSVPFAPLPSRRAREIIIPVSQPHHKSRAMRSETRSTLVRSIAVGRRWLNEIADGSTASPDIIAAREGCSARHVTKMMSLRLPRP